MCSSWTALRPCTGVCAYRASRGFCGAQSLFWQGASRRVHFTPTLRRGHARVQESVHPSKRSFSSLQFSSF